MRAELNGLNQSRRFLRAFLKRQDGVSAIEFALIAPLLVTGLLGLADVGTMVYGRTQMHTALRSGAQYFMAGGTDSAGATDVITKSWPGMPQGTTVDVTNYCECGAASGTCGQLCPDQSYPDVFYRIEVKTALGTLFNVPQTMSENIRAR